VLAESTTLRTGDLPERVREPADPIALELAKGGFKIPEMVRFVEVVLIRRALEQTKGNRTHAARLLDISHRALLYKLKEYGIT
jgi:two-component system response regulator AtoC